MLIFFCKNNTQLAWADVEDNLILYTNSRTEVPGIETDKLIRASDIIQQNIVTYEREFQFSMTLEKEKDGPVLNDHDFPGTYSLQRKNVTYRLKRCDKKGNERIPFREHNNS